MLAPRGHDRPGALGEGTGCPAASGWIGSRWSGPVTISLPGGVLERPAGTADRFTDGGDPVRRAGGALISVMGQGLADALTVTLGFRVQGLGSGVCLDNILFGLGFRV